MELNVVLRGQSNALLFADYGAVWEMERQLEQKLGGGTDIQILYRYGDANGRNTINSGSAFMSWDTDGKQAGFMNYLNGLPESVQDNPTITVWMHNEFDGNAPITTADWVREVRTDAALVRGALGQGAPATPYLFTWVPYPYVWGDSPEKIRAGMSQLAADGSFNAELALDATNGIAMDGDGYAGSGHIGRNDAQVIAGRLATALAPMASELVGAAPSTPTTPTEPTTPTAPPAGGQPVALSAGSGGDALVLKVSQDAYQGPAQYTVRVDGVQVGGTFSASASRSSGQSDTLTLNGDWAAGSHQVEVRFLNDAWGGTAATDRNLYVDSAAYNGQAVPGAAKALMSAGPASFGFLDPLV